MVWPFRGIMENTNFNVRSFSNIPCRIVRLKCLIVIFILQIPDFLVVLMLNAPPPSNLLLYIAEDEL